MQRTIIQKTLSFLDASCGPSSFVKLSFIDRYLFSQEMTWTEILTTQEFKRTYSHHHCFSVLGRKVVLIDLLLAVLYRTSFPQQLKKEKVRKRSVISSSDSLCCTEYMLRNALKVKPFLNTGSISWDVEYGRKYGWIIQITYSLFLLEIIYLAPIATGFYYNDTES